MSFRKSRSPIFRNRSLTATVSQVAQKAGVIMWHGDENLVDLETDKVVLEVPAPADGILKEISADTGETVTEGQTLGLLEEGEAPESSEKGRRFRGDRIPVTRISRAKESKGKESDGRPSARSRMAAKKGRCFRHRRHARAAADNDVDTAEVCRQRARRTGDQARCP